MPPASLSWKVMATAFPTEAARGHLKTVVFPMTPSRAEDYRHTSVENVLTRARAEAEAMDVGEEEGADLRLWRYRACVRHAKYRSRAQSPRPPTLVFPVVEGEKEEEAQKEQEVHTGGVMPGCSNKSCRAAGSDAFVTLTFVQRRAADEGMTPEYTCSKCCTKVYF